MKTIGVIKISRREVRKKVRKALSPPTRSILGRNIYNRRRNVIILRREKNNLE